jgi:hypothetical protein
MSHVDKRLAAIPAIPPIVIGHERFFYPLRVKMNCSDGKCGAMLRSGRRCENNTSNRRCHFHQNVEEEGENVVTLQIGDLGEYLDLGEHYSEFYDVDQRKIPIRWRTVQSLKDTFSRITGVPINNLPNITFYGFYEDEGESDETTPETDEEIQRLLNQIANGNLTDAQISVGIDNLPSRYRQAAAENVVQFLDDRFLDDLNE